MASRPDALTAAGSGREDRDNGDGGGSPAVVDFTAEIAEAAASLRAAEAKIAAEMPDRSQIMRDWAATTVALPPGEREEARQTKIAVLKGLSDAPARLVDAYLSEAAAPSDGRGAAPVTLTLNDPEPWPEEVDGAALLDELADTFSRFVALPEAGAEALALAVLHSYVFDSFYTCPMLVLVSAVKRSGKTTALSVAGAIVSRALPASNITPAALFRSVEKHRPTLLIDEADSFLRDNEELRGILNAGHTRTAAFVIRTVGDDHEPVQFSVWCPKMLAGIGKLAGTLEDRSIILHMRRRAPGEHVERLRLDRLADLDHLRHRCRRWADDHGAELCQADPDVPPLASDRAADNWRPMLAIAGAAGGEWPARARWAAIVLTGIDESDGAAGQLLADLRDLFALNHTERLSSEDVVRALGKMEDRPWPEWYRSKEPITRRQLAALLKPFGIHPKKYREGTATQRGYLLEDFADAFARYLEPVPGAESGTGGTPLQTGTFSSGTGENAGTDVPHEKPLICGDVPDVPDESPRLDLEQAKVILEATEIVVSVEPVPTKYTKVVREAAHTIVNVGAVSTNLLVARHGLYEAEAESVIDLLEAAGIVGPPEGKDRPVRAESDDIERLIAAAEGIRT